MAFEQIRFDTEGAVAILTLDRPERMNAWTWQMSRELAEAIEACNDDPAIGAIVVTGAGRGFCAGADIEDTFRARQQGGEPDRSAHDPITWVDRVRQAKPMVAAVNGAAVGVGVTMVLPMDVIVASDLARFAMGFIKMGLVPELASSHFLVQRMGFGRASEVCLTGRLYSAQEAQQMGLVDHLVPHAQLMEKALEIAGQMAANPGPQLRWIKQLLTENGSATDLDAVMAREGALLQQAYETPEHREAIAAFLEKRAPDFARARAAGEE